MWNCLTNLWEDDSGAIVSIELIIIVTIAVLSLVVGWSEVAHSVNTELDDIGNAIGHFNQSYFFSGFRSFKLFGGTKASFNGSAFVDFPDDCDHCSGFSTITCFGPGVGFGSGVGVGGGSYSAPVHPGPAPIQPGVPCPTIDCIPDQVAPGGVLTPVPDHGPQLQPVGPQGQPFGPQPGPQQPPRPDALPRF